MDEAEVETVTFNNAYPKSPAASRRDVNIIYQNGCLTAIFVMLALAIVGGFIVGYSAWYAAKDEEHVIVLKAKCTFNLMCEDLVGNTLGPVSVETYCNGAGDALGRCGFAASSDIDSSALWGAGSSDSSASPSTFNIPSAWY